MNKLKELRTERKLTIRELGEKTRISYSTISAMENEIRPFTQSNLQILCDFFGVSSDYLLGKSNDKLIKIKRDNPTPQTTFSFALHGLENDLTNDDKDIILKMAAKLANKNKD